MSDSIPQHKKLAMGKSIGAQKATAPAGKFKKGGLAKKKGC